MAVATLQVVKSNNNLVAAVPAFVTAVTELGNSVSDVNGLVMVQKKYSTGVAKDKEQAEKAAIDRAIELESAARSYAMKVHNNTMLNSLQHKDWGLERMRDMDTLAELKVILEILKNNLAALEDYGVTQQDIEDLTADIVLYDALIQSPREAISARAAASKQLPIALATMKAILEELDGHVARMKSKQPMFYNAFGTARVIVDNFGKGSGGKNEDTGTDTDVPKDGGTKQ